MVRNANAALGVERYMSLSLLPLVIHSHAVPVSARNALMAAYTAAPERRDAMLESAARVLYAETDLDCTDVRELVGLPEGNCSCS
jgi:hypothetical protein